MQKALFVFGTRPEAIKLLPLVREMRSSGAFQAEVCVTAQHRQMLDQVLDIFDVRPEYDLDIMRPNQTLAGLTSRLVKALDDVLEHSKPDLVIVQGDTTSTFCGALTAFYRQVKVAHVEAGLRTHSRFAPFPEEINRRLTAHLTDWHFVPTERARQALLRENFNDDTIHVVGNTVIDALLFAVQKVRSEAARFERQFDFLRVGHEMVLITGHRRENFGAGMEGFCKAVRDLAQQRPELDFVYAVHLNPNVQKPVNRILSGLNNVHLIPPQDYLSFVWLMDRSRLILTDSGGIQEEAPALGKPVIVTREVTERMEAVEAGVARLVGTDRKKIVATVSSLLDDPQAYEAMSRTANPYGSGDTSQRIVEILQGC